MTIDEVRVHQGSTMRTVWRASFAMLSVAGTIVGTEAALTSAASATTTAGTSASCPSRALGTPFTKWDDSNKYFLVPNGGFENGTTGWSLSAGAAVTSGNEPYLVSGPGTHDLIVPNGGQAQSQPMCVARNEDSIRLFVYNRGVNGSILHVEAEVQNPQTGATAQTAFDVNGNASPLGWSPTMVLGIPDLLSGNGTQLLTLIFTTRGAAATWNIDDVYVDPFISR
jgi:hypothetical protein